VEAMKKLSILHFVHNSPYYMSIMWSHKKEVVSSYISCGYSEVMSVGDLFINIYVVYFSLTQGGNREYIIILSQ